jgi:hypothetical protein
MTKVALILALMLLPSAVFAHGRHYLYDGMVDELMKRYPDYSEEGRRWVADDLVFTLREERKVFVAVFEAWERNDRKALDDALVRVCEWYKKTIERNSPEQIREEMMNPLTCDKH